MELLRRVNSIPGIDYMTIHIWPYNWGWAREDALEEDISAAIERTAEYIQSHSVLAEELGMPVVLEEFGYPRDGFKTGSEVSTHARDAYYEYVFSRVGKELDGANFWGWSGFAVPSGSEWKRGDPYTGDPAQEAQGLNGVYVTDSTVDIICKAANHQIL
jgi:mannan endo-1,4-beta-mannosidase